LTVLTGGHDRAIRLWDATTGEEVQTFVGPPDAIRCLVLNAAESLLVTGGDGGHVRVWDLKTGTCQATVQSDGSTVHALVLAADGRLFTGNRNGEAKCWDLQSGRCLAIYDNHPGGVRSLCLSLDGRCLATGGYDNVVRLWDTESGLCLHTFAGGHTDWVRSVAFTPDGTRLITAGRDGLVIIWDVASGDILATLHNLNEGFLWTTPPDSLAPHGWVWTDREDLLIVSEEDTAGGNAQVLDEKDSKRRDYLSTHNNQRRVMRKIQLRGEEDLNRMTELLGLHVAIRQSEAEIKRLTHME
jgi:WD40 repeat protein